MKHSPAMQSAIHYLYSYIDKHHSQHSSRLPTIKELATKSGVASATMWKAVRCLQEQGLLSARPKKGIFIQPLASDVKHALGFLHEKINLFTAMGELVLPSTTVLIDQSGFSEKVINEALSILRNQKQVHFELDGTITITPTAHRNNASSPDMEIRSKQELLTNVIKNDIINHTYPPESILPRYKELSSKYGACYRLLKQSLETLVHQDLITPYKRRYRVRKNVYTQPYSSITIISNSVPNLRIGRILSNLEEQCSEMNISLKKVLIESAGQSWFRIDPASIVDLHRTQKDGSDKQKSLLQFDSPDFTNSMGFIVMFTGTDTYDEFIFDLSCRFKQPIAILDQTGEFDWSSFKNANSPIYRFILSNTSNCGRMVGQYLLGCGHRKIAYISPYHQSKWSQNRLLGLKECSKNADPEVEIIPCTCHYEQRQTLYDAHKELQIIARHIMDSAIPVRQNVRELFKSLTYHDIDYITAGLMHERFHTVLASLFENALDHTDVTAWVAANDEIAVHALRYLSEKQIAVPQTISLIGFDDSVDATIVGLTSYNFNYAKIIQSMLNNIVYHDSHKKVTSFKLRSTEIEGYVIERSST